LAKYNMPPLTDGVNAKKFLRRPEVEYDLVAQLTPPPQPLSREVIEQVTIETKFEGYLAKQQNQIDRVKRLESMPIPRDFNFDALRGLRLEARQKLSRFQPATLGQASRIAGVNPADVSILLVHLERQNGAKG
jgi:tRNA uridine 5-carboxymethylaminomethyl modification enzyme